MSLDVGHFTVALLTKRYSEHGKKNRILQRLNQIYLYKTLIQILVFDDSDEIENMFPCY